jgi:hypothetical protein
LSPTISDNFSCENDCSETYEECCENSNGNWDADYGTCNKDTNTNDNDDTGWDGTYCWGNADESGFAVEDCSGTCNGNAVEDNCGICDDDNSNDCIMDCSGTWGGDYKYTCYFIEYTDNDSTFKILRNIIETECVPSDSSIHNGIWSEDGFDDCGNCGGSNFLGESDTFADPESELYGQCNCDSLQCGCDEICLEGGYLDCNGECGGDATEYFEDWGTDEEENTNDEDGTENDGVVDEYCCGSGDFDCLE